MLIVINGNIQLEFQRNFTFEHFHLVFTLTFPIFRRNCNRKIFVFLLWIKLFETWTCKKSYTFHLFRFSNFFSLQLQAGFSEGLLQRRDSICKATFDWKAINSVLCVGIEKSTNAHKVEFSTHSSEITSRNLSIKVQNFLFPKYIAFDLCVGNLVALRFQINF